MQYAEESGSLNPKSELEEGGIYKGCYTSLLVATANAKAEMRLKRLRVQYLY